MLRFKDVRARAQTCLRCGGSVRIGGPLDRLARAQLLRALTTGHFSAPMCVIVEETGCSFEEAMETLRHLTRIAGQCHACKANIPVADYVDCPKCGELNITVPPIRTLARGSGRNAIRTRCPVTRPRARQ